MSKKKSRKKQQFKYGQAQRPAAASSVSATQTGSDAAQQPMQSKGQVKLQQALAGVDDFSYVQRDLVRVGIFAAICIGIELALYLTFQHTAVGPRIYSLFTL